MLNRLRWITVAALLATGLAVMWPVSVNLTPLLRTNTGVWDAQPELTATGPSHIITVGTAASAAGTADYTTDGVADDVQFQAALDALPATGGRIAVMGGTYNWTALTTVSRAIDNVVWEGAGLATYINSDGVTAAISAGAQSGWVVIGMRFDAAGLDVSTASARNVEVGTAVYGRNTYVGMVEVAKSNATYTTIQSAVTYAASQSPTAANRWAVLVHPGTYTEQVVSAQYVDLVGVDKGASIIAITGGQTGITAAANSDIRNLTISVTADGAGDAYGINTNDVSVVIEDVIIPLTRTANTPIGVYDDTNSTQTITLRNVNIYQVSGGIGRGVQFGDAGGAQGNKTLNIYGSHINPSNQAVQLDAANPGNRYYFEVKDSYLYGTGFVSDSGGQIKDSFLDDLVFVAGDAGYGDIELYNTYIDELKNDSPNRRIFAYNSYARTVEADTAGGSTEWYSGGLRIVESATYPLPPAGNLVWYYGDRIMRVLPKMSIQAAIDATAADLPAPSATYPHTVLVDPDIYTEEITMAQYVNVVSRDKADTTISVTGGQTAITGALGANIQNLTIQATADGGGSGIAIDVNNAAFTVEDVNINLSRSANSAFGVFEATGATARTVTLRNVRIVGSNASIVGIYNNQLNKTFVIDRSHIETTQYGVWIDGAATNIISTNNYYAATGNDWAVTGGTIVSEGDSFTGVGTVGVQISGGSPAFRNTFIRTILSNVGSGTVTVEGGALSAGVRTTSGPVNVSLPGGIEERYLYRAHNSALFNAAGLTDSEAIFAQPADSVLLGVSTELRTQFAAAGLSDLDVTVGDGGDNTGILNNAMNGFSDAVDSYYKDRGAYWNAATAAGYYSAGGVTWTAYATAVGANLNTTSAGGLQFRFTYRQL